MSFKYDVTIIYTSSYDNKDNKKTLSLIANQLKANKKLQVVFVNLSKKSDIKKMVSDLNSEYKNRTSIIEKIDASIYEAYEVAMKQVEAEWFTCVNAGDSFSDNYVANMYSYAKSCKDSNIVMASKTIDDGASILSEPYSCDENIAGKYLIDLDRFSKSVPMCFNGTFLKSELLKKYKLKVDLGYDAENEFFTRLILDNRKVGALAKEKYFFSEAKDYMFRRFLGLYDRDWYYSSIDNFMIPLLEDAKEKYGSIPVTVQYVILGFLMHRLDGNMDNRNKHILDDNEAKEYIGYFRKVLQFIDDINIVNMQEVLYYTLNPADQRMFIQIKYNDFDYKFNYYLENRSLDIACKDNIFYSTFLMRVNIMFMEYFDGKLEIDAQYPDFFKQVGTKMYAYFGNKRYECVEEEDYSLTKYFGLSAYKKIKIHVSIPFKNISTTALQFVIEYGDNEYVVMPEYKSHTSRLSGRLRGMYWKFDKYMAYHHVDRIIFKKATKKAIIRKELSMAKELLTTTTYGTYCMKILLLRELYWLTRPFYKNKRIWMFYDKIYKGGDSSEYIYKYAKKQKDKVKKYYLLDEKACDYKRMKKEGYRPLKRGTLKHKLVFMNADMVIASNSTVFAFNDFPMGASAYFRGTFDFHVACVQHGMSVQKIAIAQKRLRDNTRLYFCASKYEIENLSKPIYNYNGYNALRLTGVPRYDGLVDEAEKQIMIAPTWRMQSAMLVVKNEGVQRDYNENFKDTPYYKVFNSLINDSRLIAAAKKYGYRIKYVLHPIVSPQVNDFDKNDYVDIISAIGDMSYEELFRKSSLMVTDFSGIQFDFAYMRKPLVYLHHKDIPQHYEEGTYHYDTMAFGEICHDNDELIDLLCEYMKDGCVMKEEYKKRADDFFEFNDHNNCERIYKEMIKYQNERIDILKGRKK